MTGVLLGSGVVSVLVALGFATSALPPAEAEPIRRGLTPVVYHLTNPALTLVLVAGTDLGAVLSVYTPVTLVTAAVTGALFVLFSGLLLHRGRARTAVGAMAASYVNAGNIGLPIALYAVGSPAPVASVPLLLLLFGMSLHGQRPFRNRALVPDVIGGTVIKLAAMPAAAWALGRYGFGLGGTELLGVVVMAALPTAQNVFLFSSRFRMPANTARDIVLPSSFLSFPAILLVSLLLHRRPRDAPERAGTHRDMRSDLVRSTVDPARTTTGAPRSLSHEETAPCRPRPTPRTARPPPAGPWCTWACAWCSWA